MNQKIPSTYNKKIVKCQQANVKFKIGRFLIFKILDLLNINIKSSFKELTKE